MNDTEIELEDPQGPDESGHCPDCNTFLADETLPCPVCAAAED
jgi:hypothetical protein